MNREILFKGKRKDSGMWEYGNLSMRDETGRSKYYIGQNMLGYEVVPETIGRYTGLKDKNGVKIFEGDIVKLFVFRGQIIQICGAFGVSVESAIDWDYLASEINPVTGYDNSPNFCQNDNFVSLWELMWNYNQEENMCGVIEVIGNIHDNPELVRKDEGNEEI